MEIKEGDNVFFIGSSSYYERVTKGVVYKVLNITRIGDVYVNDRTPYQSWGSIEFQKSFVLDSTLVRAIYGGIDEIK